VSRERVLSDLALLKRLLPVDDPVKTESPVGTISQADRRSYIEHHRAELESAGLWRLVQDAELRDARVVA